MFQNKRLLLVAALTVLALLATQAARADDPKPGDPPVKPSDETTMRCDVHASMSTCG